VENPATKPETALKRCSKTNSKRTGGRIIWKAAAHTAVTKPEDQLKRFPPSKNRQTGDRHHEASKPISAQSSFDRV
jgi:hypothetical protein